MEANCFAWILYRNHSDDFELHDWVLYECLNYVIECMIELC